MNYKKIFEAKNLDIFKKLLRILADYSKDLPATGTDRLLNAALEQGVKIIPKDKQALTILDNVLDEDNLPGTVQKLLNARFSNCPAECRPTHKAGKRYEVAWWTRGDKTSDRVKDLIDWDGKGGVGKWANIDGEKVTLIDMSKEKEVK